MNDLRLFQGIDPQKTEPVSVRELAILRHVFHKATFRVANEPLLDRLLAAATLAAEQDDRDRYIRLMDQFEAVARDQQTLPDLSRKAV